METKVLKSKKNGKAKWRSVCERFLESYPFVIFVAIVTVYTLFFDDIRVVAFKMEEDYIFYLITTVCLAIFTVEIFFASLCRDEYFLTFFFWLDIVATLSMLSDIGWVWDVIMGVGTTPQAGNAG